MATHDPAFLLKIELEKSVIEQRTTELHNQLKLIQGLSFRVTNFHHTPRNNSHLTKYYLDCRIYTTNTTLLLTGVSAVIKYIDAL